MSDMKYFSDKIYKCNKDLERLKEREVEIDKDETDLSSRLRHGLKYNETGDWESFMEQSDLQELRLGQFNWYTMDYGFNDSPAPGKPWDTLAKDHDFFRVYPKRKLYQQRDKSFYDGMKQIRFFVLKRRENANQSGNSNRKYRNSRYFLNYAIYNTTTKAQEEIGYAGNMDPSNEWNGRNIIPRTLRKKKQGWVSRIRGRTGITEYWFDSLASTYETALHFCRKVIATKKGDPNHYYHSTPTPKWRRTRKRSLSNTAVRRTKHKPNNTANV